MNERKLLRAVWVEVVDDMKYLIKVIDVDPIQQRLWFVPSLVGVLYAYYNTISDSFDDLCSSKLMRFAVEGWKVFRHHGILKIEDFFNF